MITNFLRYHPLESWSSRQARNQTSKSQNRIEEERSVIRARLTRGREVIEPRRGTQRQGGWVGPLRESNLDPILSQVFLRRQERAIGRRDPWLTVCLLCPAPPLLSFPSPSFASSRLSPF